MPNADPHAADPHAYEPRAFGRGAGLSPYARLMRLRIVVWLVGVGGFVGLLLASRYLPHPDVWRGIAVIWFLIAGCANTYLVLKRP